MSTEITDSERGLEVTTGQETVYGKMSAIEREAEKPTQVVYESRRPERKRQPLTAHGTKLPTGIRRKVARSTEDTGWAEIIYPIPPEKKVIITQELEKEKKSMGNESLTADNGVDEKQKQITKDIKIPELPKSKVKKRSGKIKSKDKAKSQSEPKAQSEIEPECGLASALGMPVSEEKHEVPGAVYMKELGDYFKKNELTDTSENRQQFEYERCIKVRANDKDHVEHSKINIKVKPGSNKKKAKLAVGKVFKNVLGITDIARDIVLPPGYRMLGSNEYSKEYNEWYNNQPEDADVNQDAFETDTKVIPKPSDRDFIEEQFENKSMIGLRG